MVYVTYIFFSDQKIFINSGLSETPNNKKFNEKLAVDHPACSDALSIKSMGSNDIRAPETDDVIIIQK